LTGVARSPLQSSRVAQSREPDVKQLSVSSSGFASESGFNSTAEPDYT